MPRVSVMRKLLALLSALVTSCAATLQEAPTPLAPPPAVIPLETVATPSDPVDLAGAYERYLGPHRSLSLRAFRAVAATWPSTAGALNPDPPGPMECNVELSGARRSGDGAWIAVVGKEGVVILDAKTRELKRFLALPGSLSLLDEIPDTPLLVVQQFLSNAEHKFHLLLVDLETGAVTARFDDTSQHIAVAPGKLAYATTNGLAHIHVWDASNHRELVNAPSDQRWMAFLHDGALFAATVGGHVHLWELSPTGEVSEWSTPQESSPVGFGGSVPEMQPGGTLLAYAHARGVTLVDTRTHLTVASSEVCPEQSERMAWSSDGRLLAVSAGLHACVLEVPSLRLKGKTPDLRARLHSVFFEDAGATQVRFIGSSGLMVRAAIDATTKVFDVRSMKVLWGGATDDLAELDGVEGGLVLKAFRDEGAPDAGTSIVTLDPSNPNESKRVKRRKATPEEDKGAVSPPEARERPWDAAARIASSVVLPLHGHIVPREVCGPKSTPAPVSRSDAGPYTAFLDTLDAEHVRYVTGSESGFYVEGDVPWLCVPMKERAEGKASTWWRCWRWPQGLPRALDDTYAEYDAEHILTGVRVYASDATFVLKVGSTKEEPTLTISQVWVPATVQRYRVADSLDYSMPPSRRPHVLPNPYQPEWRSPRSHPRKWKAGRPELIGVALESPHGRQAQSIARALESFGEVGRDTRIRSAEHEGLSLVSLSFSNGSGPDAYEAIWICQRSLGRSRSCMQSDQETRLGEFIAIDPEKTLPAGWLLLATDSHGPRGGDNALVWVNVEDGALKASELAVGWAGGIGSHCDSGDGTGYCVSMEGTWTPFDLVGPDCVRIRPSTHWFAVHDRAGDRWLHEELEGPVSTGRPITYRAGPDGWKRQACPSSVTVAAPPAVP